LAAVAHVFGLDAPGVATARVLEIGCAAGGNFVERPVFDEVSRARENTCGATGFSGRFSVISELGSRCFLRRRFEAALVGGTTRM
jgi:hypothetical protein